jgi:carboxypeptidase C (cathepsin A)
MVFALVCMTSALAAQERLQRPGQPAANWRCQQPAPTPRSSRSASDHLRRDQQDETRRPAVTASLRRRTAEEKISQTSHTVRVDGRDVKYTATAGTLPIRLDDGKVAARMFFVAYTKDGEDSKTRPVSFLYNGGPGSATVWLHMGSFAPRKVQMADDGFQPAPPYNLIDNDTSIDTTDWCSDVSTGCHGRRR